MMKVVFLCEGLMVTCATTSGHVCNNYMGFAHPQTHLANSPQKKEQSSN